MGLDVGLGWFLCLRCLSGFHVFLFVQIQMFLLLKVWFGLFDVLDRG